MRNPVKLVAVIGGALATALVTGGLLAGQAFAAPAQPPAPNSGCGAALLALSNAEKAVADALAADEAATAAKKADDAQADADAAVVAARAAAVNGGVETADLADNGAALRARKAVLLAIPVADRTDAQKDELIKIDAKLALIDAFVAAQTKAAAAKVVADKTDADALRREADKTDAAALSDAAAKAGTAADRACGNTGNVRFENCDQVRNAGKAPLRFDQPGYRVGLDADRDGFACEAVESTVTPRPTPAPRVTGIDTGLV
jgi:hypothetical protein